MPKTFCMVALLSCVLLYWPASAHEFWIEPESASRAQVRVGQMLVGENLPYLDRIIRSARHFAPNGDRTLDGRQGDIPALSVDLTAPGLHLLTVETQPAYIVFDTIAEFGEYLAYEGLQAVVSQHRARSLPTTEIAEEYFRYARSLVQVGPARVADLDAPIGLRYELVAVTSPFAAKNGIVELQLLWEGKPERGAQIAVFHRSNLKDAAVVRELLSSDDQGKLTVNVADPGMYVFNSVHMLSAEGPGSVVWQSHWASLSFSIANVDPSN